MDTAIKYLLAQPAKYASYLQDVLLLVARVYVGWQFWKAGVLKYQSWDSTVFLFQYEYQVPLLSPNLAAILGTFGELFFPALLFIGLTGRLAAVGLSLVNIMAVVAYSHVIFAEGFESSVTGHIYWGLMLLTVIAFGPGKLSLDYVLSRLFNRGNRGHSAF